jgi:hypothetical protein
MSFDVLFWRYEGALDRDHAAVASALVKGDAVDGVAELPADQMIVRLGEVLAGWTRVDPNTWEKPKVYLQAWPSPRHLTLNMSYAAARPVLLKIATPMRRFGCGLWNPQLGRRLAGYGEGETGDPR